MVSFIVQIGIASTLFIFSSIAAWYEGSEIMDNPWEWRYSTPFTQLVKGGVSYANEILPLDYFVYAIKFQPTFPIIMLLTSLYLFIIIGHRLLKQRKKWFAYFLTFIGGTFVIVSYFTYSSPTVGGRMMFKLFLALGFLFIGIGLMSYFVRFNRMKVKRGIN
nr:YjdJ family protein [Heyndrickxia oleronia]